MADGCYKKIEITIEINIFEVVQDITNDT